MPEAGQFFSNVNTQVTYLMFLQVKESLSIPPGNSSSNSFSIVGHFASMESDVTEEISIRWLAVIMIKLLERTFELALNN